VFNISSKWLKQCVFALVGVVVLLGVRPVMTTLTLAQEQDRYQITLSVDGRTGTHQTGAENVGQFLAENDITIHPGDRLNHRLNRRVYEGMQVDIARAFYIKAWVDGEYTIMRVPAGTTMGTLRDTLQTAVSQPLIHAGDDTDVLSPTDNPAFYTWEIVRRHENGEIAYERVYTNAASLPTGETRVYQAGQPGQWEIEKTVTYVGGAPHTTRIVNESRTEPQHEIVHRGTGFALGALTDTSCPTFHYRRRVVKEATAYTAGFSCTGRRPVDRFYRITASGREVEHGIVAVDRNVIPLGTRLYVEGYGFAIAADVGGAIRGNKIDLFMECINDARRFGRRNVVVYVLY